MTPRPLFESVSWNDFLPNQNDDCLLRSEIKVLVGRDLINYIDDLKWMDDFVPSMISHKNDEEVIKQSEIVSI